MLTQHLLSGFEKPVKQSNILAMTMSKEFLIHLTEHTAILENVISQNKNFWSKYLLPGSGQQNEMPGIKQTLELCHHL